MPVITFKTPTGNHSSAIL